MYVRERERECICVPCCGVHALACAFLFLQRRACSHISLPTALLAVPDYFENRGVFSTTVDGVTGRNIIALSGTHSPVRVQITPDSEIIGGAVYVANATSTHCRRCSDK